MSKKEIAQFQKNLKELFSELKNIRSEEKVKIKRVVVGELTEQAVKVIQGRKKQVLISSRVLKHIYERRHRDIKIVIEKIPLAICLPDEILFNIKTAGTVFFVKNHTKLFATLVEINSIEERNEVITAFLTSRRYLKKFGQPGRSDVPPSTTKMWSASDQKISALQATKNSLAKKGRKVNISVVIPNYNGEKLLKKNLPRVVKECQVSGVRCQEIIVVDDGSTDNSRKYLKAQSSKLKVTTKNLKLNIVKNRENLGFSSTVNRGVREASGEIVILLNTDVYPEKGFLEAILPHFADSKIFAVGMMDKSIEDGKIVRRGRGIGEWKRGFYVHRRGEVDKTDTAWVAGGSGAFRKSIFLKLGGFDQIYNPFYWEDIDLSYRAVRAGYKILFEPESFVVHEHEKGAIKSAYSKTEIKMIAYRNQFLFVWRNASIIQLIAHILWLPYHMVTNALRGNILFFKGLWMGLNRIPAIITERLKTGL